MSKRVINKDVINNKIVDTFGVKLLTEYECQNDKSDFICLRCNHRWVADVGTAFYKGIKCPECWNKEMRLSNEDITKKINNKPIKMIGSYSGSIGDKHKWLCLKCNKTWMATVRCVCYGGTGCPNCRRLNPEKINNRLKIKNIKIIGTYKNNSTKTMFECYKCGHKWMRIPNQLLSKKGSCCPSCLNKKCIEKAKKHLDELNLEMAEEYISWKAKIKLKCKICGHIIMMSVGKAKGCPECSTLKNEKNTGIFLKELFPDKEIYHLYHIFPYKEKSKKIVVDFALKINEKMLFVEYNGIQHYQPVKFWEKDGNNIKYKNQVKRDKKLREYCKNNDITLIEIDGRKYKNKKIKDHLQKVFFKKSIL